MLPVSELQTISISLDIIWLVILSFLLYSHYCLCKILLYRPAQKRRVGLFFKGVFIFTFFEPFLIDLYQG